MVILLGIVILLGSFAAWYVGRERGPSLQRHLRDELDRLRRDLQDSHEKDREYFQKRVEHLSDLLSKGMSETSKTMQGQFKQSAAIVKEVTEKLTQLDETNKQVLNFSEQLRDLEQILKQPKGKGILSEYWLEALLGHVLQPTQYQMQYGFPNGDIVDAVVFFQEKIIPIDAKFSSEKYSQILKEKHEERRSELEKEFKRDLKMRIDETAKYIRPEEGTVDFAFMFLPAEGIFYDLVVEKVGTVEVNRVNLIEYAFGKRVIIVSPLTFFAYLQTVLQGLKAFRMEESVQEVLKKIEQLGKHLSSYESHMQKLGSHLSTTVNIYNSAYKEFQKVDKDVFKLSDGNAGGSADPLILDQPTAHIEEAFEKVTVKHVAKA